MEVENPHPLDAVMADRGLSLAGVAALYRAAVADHGLRSGADRNLIWKWKTGRRTPTVESQRYLADALGVPRDVLADDGWPGWLWQAITTTTHVLQSPWTPAGTMRALHDIAGGPVDRRDFLVITGSTLTGVASTWGTSLTDPMKSMTSRSGSGLSSETLEAINGRLAALRRLDDALGGHEIHQLAEAEFRWLSQLAGSTARGGSVDGRLLGLITEAARLCGWCHFDARHHAAAQSYYVAALRASASAADPLTGAHTLACMSLQAMFTGHPRDAVSLIDSAEERLRHDGTPRLKALLASRKARAYARCGDVDACGRALNQAETHLDKTRPGEYEPDWIYYFDDAELAAQAAACWIDTRRPARARPLIDGALRAMDAGYVRDRAIYHARSAQAYFHETELDPACRELATAAQLAHQTDSMHALDTIREVRHGMAHHERDGRVRELDQHLATLGAMA